MTPHYAVDFSIGLTIGIAVLLTLRVVGWLLSRPARRYRHPQWEAPPPHWRDTYGD